MLEVQVNYYADHTGHVAIINNLWSIRPFSTMAEPKRNGDYCLGRIFINTYNPAIVQ